MRTPIWRKSDKSSMVVLMRHPDWGRIAAVALGRTTGSVGAARQCSGQRCRRFACFAVVGRITESHDRLLGRRAVVPVAAAVLLRARRHIVGNPPKKICA